MKRPTLNLWAIVLAALTVVSCSDKKKASTASLEKRLEAFLSGQKGQIGVAVIIDGRDTVCINNDRHYPMMSVFKLHQALAVADYCQRKGIGLDSTFYIDKSDLKPDTYSPLRDKFPDGNIRLSVGELLQYTLHLSDNNACDILFDRTVSPSETDRYLRTALGLDNFAISATEDDMHRDMNLCYNNWTTPLETARLIEKMFTEEIGKSSFHDFLKEALLSCQTGKNRLARGLEGTDATLGHKTGTGDRDADGRLTGINDAGFVRLPDGRHYTITVFITEYEGSAEEAESLIAGLSRLTYRYVCETK